MDKLLSLLIALSMTLTGCGVSGTTPTPPSTPNTSTSQTTTVTDSNQTTQTTTNTPESSGTTSTESSFTIDLSSIPEFSGNAYVAINDNKPTFSQSDLTTASFETYSNLDSLGRCGVAYANVGQDLMPTEERGSIGQVKPTGWHTIKYDNVDGKYLYNRCHLIGYQLTAENANTKNLITGTRYLNIQGMLPFENMVADYVKETNNHVLYRVTPIFDGNNLVASGVTMEAMSVEDNGEGISFNVYCYNNQPGITINYATGDSYADGSTSNSSQSSSSNQTTTTAPATTPTPNTNVSESTSQSTSSTYILNTNSKKFHVPTCSSVGQMKESNKQEYTGSRDEIIAQGYEPCKRCNP